MKNESEDTGCCSVFEEQCSAVGGGWTAMRYHGDDGERVAEMLSFKAVFDINPFEVGRGHAAERRGYNARRGLVLDALDVKPLLRRPFASLSNGEMRRVLLARALLRCPERLVVRDSFSGLDPDWRERMRGLPEAIRGTGTELVLEETRGGRLDAKDGSWAKRRQGGTSSRTWTPKPVVEMHGVDLSFGRRVLFKDFSWTVREGERWVLRGPNGSGKTTLLALVTGDSPLSYAFDIRLFGRRRGEPGVVLADLRRHVGVVSAEREAMLGESLETQLDAALVRTTRLLLLDEPCCNLSAQRSRAALERVARWLDAHPKVAAVCVAHSKAHVPPGFDRQLVLPVDGPFLSREASRMKKK